MIERSCLQILRNGDWRWRLLAVVLVITIYVYPCLKARSELGSSILPPMFAPDLSLYLNLSTVSEVQGNEVLNPYYRIPVPNNGTGYLKFRLAASLFGSFNRFLHGRMRLALLLWNVLWWALLCIVALWLFERFFPNASTPIAVAALALVMLFNFGILKTLLLAWFQLPSLAAFSTIGLPFMRAFIPIIPSVLLLAYLGLQMEALRHRHIGAWVVMGALQLFALATFPYATLMMAGVTAISLLSQIRSVEKNLNTWVTAFVFGMACAGLDLLFIRHSSVDFYDNYSSPIHLQAHLLPHLVGGNLILLAMLTLATGLNKRLVSEVKWPLVGLGATNVLLMLGDALVPSTTILLSHHAGHFVHLTMAILVCFLGAAVLSTADRYPTAQAIPLLCVLIVFLNGIFLAVGNYRGSLAGNRELVELSRLKSIWTPEQGDLVVARSKAVDDACGWIALSSESPVLFCTDAEVMLTPQQNRDIHRFRQALYLYLTGQDSSLLERAILGPEGSSEMYKLGYWAEAISPSAEERNEGIRAIYADLIPWLDRVEHRDTVVGTFFHNFRRVIVVDTEQNPTFDQKRLALFLNFQSSQTFEKLLLISYTPK